MTLIVTSLFLNKEKSLGESIYQCFHQRKTKNYPVFQMLRTSTKSASGCVIFPFSYFTKQALRIFPNYSGPFMVIASILSQLPIMNNSCNKLRVCNMHCSHEKLARK